MNRTLTPEQAEVLRQQLAAFDAAQENELTQAEQEAALLRRAREGAPSAREGILKTVSSTLELAAPIVGVVKVTSDPPEFHLLLDDGKAEPIRLRLGGVEVFDTQPLFGRAFLLALGWRPHRVKPPTWGKVVTQLASCAVEEKPDPALTDAGRGARWIAQYLARHAGEMVDLAKIEEHHGKNKRRDEARTIDLGLQPFRDEKGLHVFLDAVTRSVRTLSHGGENPTSREVARCLKSAGYVREAPKFPKPDGDGETTRSTWLVG
jgi:hypothetical protein